MGGKSITGADGPAKITPCTKHWARIDQRQFSAMRRMMRDGMVTSHKVYLAPQRDPASGG